MIVASAWLDRRREGITGSDAAAILGLDPYRTAIEVWAEKVGMLRSQDLSAVEAVKWGSIFEAPIVREVLAMTNRERARAREWPEHFQGADIEPLEHAWMEGGRRKTRTKWIIAARRVERALATPDFAFRTWRPLRVPGEQLYLEGPGIGEIKTTSAWLAARWRFGPPVRVQAQIQHELLVAGGPTWGTAAVLIGGQALRVFDVPAHGSFLRLLEDTIGTFWDRHVRTGIPPEPVGTEEERQAIARIYPRDDGSLAVLPGDYRAHAERIAELKPLLARIDNEILARETKLKAAIGRASFAVIDGTGIGFSFKADARGARRLHRMKDNALVAPSGPALRNQVEGVAGS